MAKGVSETQVSATSFMRHSCANLFNTKIKYIYIYGFISIYMYILCSGTTGHRLSSYKDIYISTTTSPVASE